MITTRRELNETQQSPNVEDTLQVIKYAGPARPPPTKLALLRCLCLDKVNIEIDEQTRAFTYSVLLHCAYIKRATI